MSKTYVVCITGACSSRLYCLEELHKRLGGAKLDLTDISPFMGEYRNLDESIIRHVKSKIRGHHLILTTGLSFSTTKKVMTMSCVNRELSFICWDVHHKASDEILISKERSLRYLFDGLMLKGKKALSLKLNPDGIFIQQSPLRHAMKFIKGEYSNIQECLEKIQDMETKANFYRVPNAIVCEEAFDHQKRIYSISEIQRVLKLA